MLDEEALDRSDKLLCGRYIHSRNDNQRTLTVQAICQQTLKMTRPLLSANANNMTTDPISLFDRLIAVKPDGLSPNAWTIKAQVSRNALGDIRKRGAANHDTVTKLLGAIGVTWAEFEAGVKQTEKEPASPEARAPRMAFQGDDRPRDVPVVGTAECGDIEFETDTENVMIELLQLDMDDVIDHVRRPVSLDNRRDVYAIYFRGDSMAPRYEPGELAYVDPKRAPGNNSYVIVQLRAPDGDDGERVCRVLAKRLVRRTAHYYELEQFHPAAIFRVPVAQVKHCHRVIPWDELVAF